MLMFWNKKKKNETIEKIKTAVSSDKPKEDMFDLDIDQIFGPLPKSKNFVKSQEMDSKNKFPEHIQDVKELQNIEEHPKIYEEVSNNKRDLYETKKNETKKINFNPSNISTKGTNTTAPKDSGKFAPNIIKKISPTPPKETGPKNQTNYEKKKTPPVFIKLTRYEEIVDQINILRSSISNMYEILNVLNEIENSRKEALETFKSSINKINGGISFLDSIIVKPSGLGIEPKKIVSEDMNKSLIQLKNELEKIKEMINKSV